MEQVGLRLFYALRAPALLLHGKANSSHCGYMLLAASGSSSGKGQ